MTAAILVYHRIGADRPGSVHDLPWSRFHRQIQALSELGLRHESGPMLRLPGGHGVVLSFDDGTDDHPAAAAALETAGWRGLFLIPAGRLGEPGRMSASDVRDLSARGHVIGAHGMTHRRFDRLTERELDGELADAAATLSDLTGAPVPWLAPPGGLCPPALAERAARHGYDMVRTVRWGYAAEPLAGLLPGLPVLSRTATATVTARARGRAPVWPGRFKDWAKGRIGEAGWEAVRKWAR
ncbi:MAG: polysaccharide deacetylase family protein [Alphaproteobacteria bacterium]